MLYEFAMTPDLFDATVLNTNDSAGIILIELLRGITDNGSLANLHKDRWYRHITEKRATSLSPALRDKVLTCLSVLHDRHRLVRHPKCMASDPENDQDWLNLALDSHDQIPFHGIILSQLLLENCDRKCDALVEFFGSLDSEQWDGRRRKTLTLTKSNSDYRSALTPILRHAKSLVLIDPYLNYQESRYFDTITICSDVLGQRGHVRLHGRIDIHADAQRHGDLRGLTNTRTVQDHLDAWEQKLKPLISKDGHRFRVFLWEPHAGAETMHDRFILTDQCGISVPGGLDCRTHSHSNKTDWNLLDEDARQFHWSEFDPATSPFKLVGSREIS